MADIIKCDCLLRVDTGMWTCAMHESDTLARSSEVLQYTLPSANPCPSRITRIATNSGALRPPHSAGEKRRVNSRKYTPNQTIYMPSITRTARQDVSLSLIVSRNAMLLAASAANARTLFVAHRKTAPAPYYVQDRSQTLLLGYNRSSIRNLLEVPRQRPHTRTAAHPHIDIDLSWDDAPSAQSRSRGMPNISRGMAIETCSATPTRSIGGLAVAKASEGV